MTSIVRVSVFLSSTKSTSVIVIRTLKNSRDMRSLLTNIFLTSFVITMDSHVMVECIQHVLDECRGTVGLGMLHCLWN